MSATATYLRSSSLTAVLLLASLFVTLGAAKSAKETPPSACADELVRFSPCLSYVASPPNNLSDSPASKCCDAFSSAAESGHAICLYYLVQDPPMLGFSVTVARLLSLSLPFAVAGTPPLLLLLFSLSAQVLDFLHHFLFPQSLISQIKSVIMKIDYDFIDPICHTESLELPPLRNTTI